MKKLLWVSMATLMLFVFCGCTKEENKVADTEVETTQTDDIKSEEVENEVISTESRTVTAESTTESIVEKVESTEAEKLVDSESESMNEDPYVGEYNSYDVDEPNLEIQKNDDGTYAIQIGIFRATTLFKCVGEKTEEGIIFTTDEKIKEITGIITLKDDIATVTFESGWTVTETKEYQYHKTSDVPNMWETDW